MGFLQNLDHSLVSGPAGRPPAEDGFQADQVHSPPDFDQERLGVHDEASIKDAAPAVSGELHGHGAWTQAGRSDRAIDAARCICLQPCSQAQPSR